MSKYPCVYMRGGTSKAVFFHEKDLPGDRSLWPDIFLKVMGTPDAKQIDGMGGTHPTTSKIAVIAPSEREGIDVDYTFFQIGVDKAVVEDHANCGNISSAVGPFAVDEGLADVTAPVTVVRIYNTNTGKVIEEHVRVKDGKAAVKGEQAITGVPGTGAPIDMYFERPGGAATGKLFPSGNKRDILSAPGYDPVEVTLIDCSNPVVCIRAEDLGLAGTELAELGRREALMRHVEAIRSVAAVKFGFVEKWEEATERSLSVPKVAIVSRPQDYVSQDGRQIRAAEMDICSRVISVGAFHKTHPITVGIAVASAARIAGTVVHELVAAGRIDETAADRNAAAASAIEEFLIGQPYGITPIRLQLEGENVLKGGTVRTARRIMDGWVYISD